ncbi:hypothetical protein D918_00078 [Trichuris suis]|uniref:Nuclear transport factor 2 domain-containing protein n=2 Tax=Trichuris suis TaxID=68888 RepID=A0A085M485_9BILA|nr:hypothetical protein M513_07163 [Trichuris suis]KHJ48966.1 hypothetical protein D918_00078 [Trichuris suis]
MTEETSRDMTIASNVATLFLRLYHKRNLYGHLSREAENLFMPDAVLIFDGNQLTSVQNIAQFYRSVHNVTSEVIHCDAQLLRRPHMPYVVMAVVTIEVDETSATQKRVYHTLVLMKNDNHYKIKSAIVRHMPI